MKVVTTFHHPSSVLTSVKCQLGSRDTEHLIVGKLDRVVVYSIQPHGLQNECSVDVWGKVLSLKAIPIPRSYRSNLILMLAHPDPELIFFTYNESESGTGELIVRKKLPLFERSQRPAEFFNDLLVHPSGQLAIVNCYTGKLKLIKLKAGNYQEDFDVSLPELNVFSIVFLSIPSPEYAIAILYLDSRLRLQLHARDINLDALELSAQPSVLLHPTTLSDNVFPSPTQIAYHLAAIPASDPYADEDDVFKGGVLVIGGRRIILFELAGQNAQEKQKGKRRRLETRKATSDANNAREKEVEREGRRRKPKASVEWPWSDVAAMCSVDRESWRFLIGDAYGRLALLSVVHVMEKGLILIPLGETSSATTLTYLTSQAVFVGSHLGDSQLITISPTPVSFSDMATLSIPAGIKTVSSSSLVSFKGKGKAAEDFADNAMDVDDDPKNNGCVVAPEGSYLTVQETHKNIAPIVDAILVDIDNIGQRQIMTCSGGRNTGSVNIVRHGADFEELGYVIGLTNITNIWPVKTIYQDTVHTHLLVSTLQSTILFRIGEADGKPILTVVKGESGLRLDTPTLVFANVVRRVKPSYNVPSKYEENSSLAVQVTKQGVFLLEMDLIIGSYTKVDEWVPDNQRDIVAASLNASQVVVGLKGGMLVVLNFTEKKLDTAAECKNLPEISAVSCTPIDSTRFVTPHIVVSYWGKNAVEILGFSANEPPLYSLYKEHQLPSLVRSLLLYNFGTDTSAKGKDYQPYLLVGLSDGSLVTFIWKDKVLQEKKLVSLGHAPIILTPCTVEGKRAVLATGSRAMLVSFDRKRLQFSPVSLKDISAASRFNVAAFTSSFALATQTGISIGRIGDLNKLHIRTVPFGSDNPRRIVYDPIMKLFGVACTQTIPRRVGGLDTTRSSFVLIDSTTYTQMSRFHCDEGEDITSATMLKPEGRGLATFCVGTYRYVMGETEPARGRILVLGTINADADLKQTGYQLSLLAAVSVKGCVYALSTVGSYIAATVNSSVELYQLNNISDEDSSNRFKHLSAWNHNYIVGHLSTFGNYLVVGDQISSISLVKVIDDQLRSVARDYGPLSPVCVEASSETNIIVANDALNLYTFSLSRQPGRTALERHGNWHLSDLVTKFLRGSLSQDMEENAQFIPKELFCTSSGRIGILLDIANPDPRLSMLLTALERNMAYVVQGIGGQGHARYRAPRGPRGRSDADAAATGFLDGDFLEQFLSYINSEETMDKIMAGTSAPERIDMRKEELQKVVENLQSLH